MSPATKSLNSEGAGLYAYLYQLTLHMFKIDKEEGITLVRMWQRSRTAEK